MKIGERLKEIRETAGMSQEALADAAGLPLGTLRVYEQGRREPGLARAKKLADALGCTVDAFVKDDAAPPAKKAKRKK